MNRDLDRLVLLPQWERAIAFEETADRLNTLPSYIEKDYWVCLVLDFLFNRLPQSHPRMWFKGGTSLSKAFGLVNRFSEDVDIVVSREDLGFAGESDPTGRGYLSNRRRKALFSELKWACSAYVRGDLRSVLTELVADVLDGCDVVPDPYDQDALSLLVRYPTMYPVSPASYVEPWVKIETGARSAVEPTEICIVAPLVAEEIPNWPLHVDNIRTVAPQRTVWDKILVLHGLHCGFRDQKRLPTSADRISRHYYDVAMILQTDLGQSALAAIDLLQDVRNHSLIAFRTAWKRIEEAVPGSIRLVPQQELRHVLEQDYRDMQHMVFGSRPEFAWIMQQLSQAEAAINRM